MREWEDVRWNLVKACHGESGLLVEQSQTWLWEAGYGEVLDFGVEQPRNEGSRS